MPKTAFNLPSCTREKFCRWSWWDLWNYQSTHHRFWKLFTFRFPSSQPYVVSLPQKISPDCCFHTPGSMLLYYMQQGAKPLQKQWQTTNKSNTPLRQQRATSLFGVGKLTKKSQQQDLRKLYTVVRCFLLQLFFFLLPKAIMMTTKALMTSLIWSFLMAMPSKVTTTAVNSCARRACDTRETEIYIRYTRIRKTLSQGCRWRKQTVVRKRV